MDTSANFSPPCLHASRRWLSAASCLLVFVLACSGAVAQAPAVPFTPPPVASAALSPTVAEQVRQLVLSRVAVPGGPRVELKLGQLDGRLRLAPCAQVDAYVPSGSRLWGASRVGLRCTQGATQWNVYLPVTVTLYGPGLQVASDLPAGHVLQTTDLRPVEVNLTEGRSPAAADLSRLVGRALSHPVAAGQTLRLDALKPRQWFAAGDNVQVRAVGGGYTVAGAGEALTAGIEGQPAKVRTDSGKIIIGQPVAERQLEVNL